MLPTCLGNRKQQVGIAHFLACIPSPSPSPLPLPFPLIRRLFHNLRTYRIRVLPQTTSNSETSLLYPSVMEACLAITEILEAILLRFDMKTLLVSATRVNKTWNQLINTSPQLQQYLFFRPMTQGVASKLPIVPPHLDLGPDDPRLNPLLVEKFSPCFFDFFTEHHPYRGSGPFYALPWTNTAQREVKYVRRSRSPRYGIRKPHPTEESVALKERQARRHFTRSGASWRRMLMTQPPPQMLGFVSIRIDPSLRLDEAWTYARMIEPGPNITSNDLVKMGYLYDLMQSYVSRFRFANLWYRIHWYQPPEEFITDLHKFYIDTQLSSKSTCLAIDIIKEPVSLNHTSPHPLEPSEFDSIFRCDESTMPNIEFQEQLVWQGSWIHRPAPKVFEDEVTPLPGPEWRPEETEETEEEGQTV